MYISVITLKVGNIDRAVDFYTQKLDWEKTMDVPMGEMRWVTVAPKDGETRASFTLTNYSPDGSPVQPGGMSGVIMECDDVYAAADRLKKLGVGFTDGPRTEPWGGWAMFKDSEGNIHGLHSPAPN